LHLAKLPILVIKLAFGVFPTTAIPNRFLRFRISKILQRTDILDGLEFPEYTNNCFG